MATKRKSPKKKAPAFDAAKLERWSEQGKAFRAAESRLRDTEFTHQWAIADWMLAGVSKFGKNRAYEVAIEATGMTRGTLEQFAHTAKKVLIRVKGVSFGHHRLVAKYDRKDQERYLNHAKEADETVESFAAFLRQLDGDEARRANGNKGTKADRAADKIMTACNALRKSGSFVMLLNRQPTQEKRTELLDGLRAVIADLTSKVERFERLWGSEKQAMGVGA
jgi:hypothetical protein